MEDKQDIENQAAIFSILADTTRLKLLKLLSQQKDPHPLCVNALAFRLGVTQPAASQHLKVLKSAGLVKGERHGYRIHYFVNEEALIKAQKLISRALSVEKQDNQNTSEVTGQ
jgi:DNA-binding transcriptional ArsR family regulator